MKYNVLRKNILVFKTFMLTMTFTNIKHIGCSLYKQLMKLNEISGMEIGLCSYMHLQLKKNVFLQNMNGGLEPLFSIIETNTYVMGFFPGGWYYLRDC